MPGRLTLLLTCGTRAHDTPSARRARERAPLPSGAAACYAAPCASSSIVLDVLAEDDSYTIEVLDTKLSNPIGLICGL